MFGGLQLGGPSSSGTSSPSSNNFGTGISLPISPAPPQSQGQAQVQGKAAGQQTNEAGAKKDPFADLASW